MSYFKHFPIINFSLDDGVTSFQIADIFRRVKAVDNNIDTSLLYDKYDIREGETPEIVADKFYNNSANHWVILLTNGIVDPRYDWPLGNEQLLAYIKRKYDITEVYDTLHYVNDDGDVVHSSYAGTKYPVSYFTYEETINEAKRPIKVLKARYVPQFVRSFQESLNV